MEALVAGQRGIKFHGDDEGIWLGIKSNVFDEMIAIMNCITLFSEVVGARPSSQNN